MTTLGMNGSLLGLLGALAATALAPRDSREVRVGVDPRVELLTVVQYLSGYQVVPGLITRYELDYKRDVEARFAEFRAHRAVQMFDTLSRRGFAFDAPVAAVLHFGPPPALEPLAEMDEAIALRAGSRESLDAFVDVLRDFARESDFMAFYAGHEAWYDVLAADARTALAGVDVEMLERYFGDRQASYDIVLAPLLHHGGFGPRVRRRDGSFAIYSVDGPHGAADGQPTFGTPADFRYLAWHEFSHSFVNPLVERFGERVDRTDVVFRALEDRMREQGYGSWRNCVYEHVVRACTVRFAAREAGAAAGQAALEEELSRGFVYTAELAQRLETYEQSRDTYRTFADHFPRLLEVFETAAATAARDPATRNPRVVATLPRTGDVGVDPGVSEILVQFDQDMDPASFAWLRRDDATYPLQTGEPRFVSARTCMLPVKLEPGRAYWIGINYGGIGGFKNTRGSAAASHVIEFKTAD